MTRRGPREKPFEEEQEQEQEQDFMTPATLRDANFDRLRDSLELRLRAVYLAFVAHGPCTTRRCAEAAGLDILSVRPRAHDLCRLGLLACTGRATGRSGKHEGIYEATTPDEWARWQATNFPTDSQVQMGLNSAGALTT